MKTLIFTACEHYYHGLFSKKKVLMNILTCEYFEHMTVWTRWSINLKLFKFVYFLATTSSWL